MNKRKTLALIIVVMIIQLLMPAGMVTGKSLEERVTLERGREYKIPIMIYACARNTVNFDYRLTEYNGAGVTDESESGTTAYVVLKENSLGFAEYDSVTYKKPDTDIYCEMKNVRYLYECFLLSDEYVAACDIDSEKVNELGMSQMYYDEPVIDIFDEDFVYTDPAVVRMPKTYVTAKVYKGNHIITGLYVDGVPIEEYAAFK